MIMFFGFKVKNRIDFYVKERNIGNIRKVRKLFSYVKQATHVAPLPVRGIISYYLI
jgi:hypothetical protein